MAADITKLRPKTQALCKLFIEACAKAGITVLITQTHRDSTLQHAYFSQGRESLAVVNANRAKAGLSALTASENKATITKADAGQSPHEFDLAFDFVPVVNGKPDWNDLKLFDRCGAIGKTLNVDGFTLEWGGDFFKFKDKPHFQMKNWKNYK